MDLDPLPFIQHVRKRPSMYLGSTTQTGLTCYLFHGISSCLENGPSLLRVSTDGNFMEIEVDSPPKISEREDGLIYPFEVPCPNGSGMKFDSWIATVNALSESSDALFIAENGTPIFYSFRNGERIANRNELAIANLPSEDKIRFQWRFQPDPAIFEGVSFDPYLVVSFLNRVSYFHSDTQFQFLHGDERNEFHHPKGMLDLFRDVSASKTILHRPITFQTSINSIKIEGVLAFHSGKENHKIAFINGEQPMHGGTHQDGFDSAIEALQANSLGIKAREKFTNGVVAVISIVHPDVMFLGPLQASIGNNDLEQQVKQSILNGCREWLALNPDVSEQLESIQTFQFYPRWHQT